MLYIAVWYMIDRRYGITGVTLTRYSTFVEMTKNGSGVQYSALT